MSILPRKKKKRKGKNPKIWLVASLFRQSNDRLLILLQNLNINARTTAKFGCRVVLGQKTQFLPDMIGKFFKKPGPEMADRIPPGQYETKGFPVLTYGDTPKVSTENWQFRIWGLAKEVTFTWSDVMAMPQSNFTADFHCVTRWSKLDVQWTGVKVTDFMKYIEVDPKASQIMEHCYGGYTTNISMEDFLREENFFAHTLFGEPLPPDHGGPLRLVVPHLYAWKSAKWINGLEFLDREELGFWERNGYHRRGEPWAEERYSGNFSF